MYADMVNILIKRIRLAHCVAKLRLDTGGGGGMNDAAELMCLIVIRPTLCVAYRRAMYLCLGRVFGISKFTEM